MRIRVILLLNLRNLLNFIENIKNDLLKKILKEIDGLGLD